MPKRKECSIDEHDWRATPRKGDERCEKCGTYFPCRRACDHFDCAAERKERKRHA